MPRQPLRKEELTPLRFLRAAKSRTPQETVEYFRNPPPHTTTRLEELACPQKKTVTGPDAPPTVNCAILEEFRSKLGTLPDVQTRPTHEDFENQNKERLTRMRCRTLSRAQTRTTHEDFEKAIEKRHTRMRLGTLPRVSTRAPDESFEKISVKAACA